MIEQKTFAVMEEFARKILMGTVPPASVRVVLWGPDANRQYQVTV